MLRLLRLLLVLLLRLGLLLVLLLRLLLLILLLRLLILLLLLLLLRLLVPRILRWHLLQLLLAHAVGLGNAGNGRLVVRLLGLAGVGFERHCPDNGGGRREAGTSGRRRRS